MVGAGDVNILFLSYFAKSLVLSMILHGRERREIVSRRDERT